MLATWKKNLVKNTIQKWKKFKNTITEKLGNFQMARVIFDQIIMY